MREIKFRGKRLDNGQWVYGSLLVWPDADCYILYKEEGDLSFVMTKIQVDPATVGQFTGMKDSNCEKIYEGDIMSIPETEYNTHIVGHIIYVDNWFAIKSRNCGSCLGLNWALSKNNAEVIGNIHDNPELLKGREK